MEFSPDQSKIVFNDAKKFIVRASPGSGKTFCISGRIAEKMRIWKYRNKGMAVLSFTNAGKDELEKSCRENFSTFITAPHFLGTIDSFINHYIFLPFGHLVLGCSGRPKLVGEPHERWYAHTPGINPYNIDYLYGCPYVSFNIEGELVLLPTYTQAVEQNILVRKGPNNKYFLVDIGYKDNGDKCKQHQELYDKKIEFLRDGYANQADANYFALKILEKYPNIAKELACKFPMFIVDEAQDTSEIQMKILDTLEQAGVDEMVYIGDPDQSIYEWNSAKPELFTEKLQLWDENSCILNESYRSTQSICDFTYNLSTLCAPPTSKTAHAVYEGIRPKFILYEDTPISKEATISNFLTEECADIPHEEVFITARGAKFFLGNSSGTSSLEDKQLFGKGNNKLGRDIFKALALYREGKMHLCIERMLYFFCKVELGGSYVQQNVFSEWKKLGGDNLERRKFSFHLMRVVGSNKVTINDAVTLTQFLNKVNELLREHFIEFSFELDNTYQNIKLNEFISKYIGYSSQSIRPTKYSISTIHGVKGKTCDAMLLFLKEKGAAGKEYKNLLLEAPSEGGFWHEEIRNIYVAMTRPRKVLTIAVPSEEEKQIWEEFFGIINTPPSSSSK